MRPATRPAHTPPPARAGLHRSRHCRIHEPRPTCVSEPGKLSVLLPPHTTRRRCGRRCPPELSHYRESNAVPVELSPYLAKLVDARKKVQRANGILKSVQVRSPRGQRSRPASLCAVSAPPPPIRSAAAMRLPPHAQAVAVPQGRLDRVGAAVAKSTATLKAQTETATPAAQQ